MLRGLARNVAYSAVAYAAISGVTLLLTPLLIARFGLAIFGNIVIARLFVPTAALGLLDFGASEITTQAVARARVDGDWARAGRIVGLLLAISVGLGLLIGLALISLAAWVPREMSVDTASVPAMLRVLRISGFVMPVLFAAMVFEGILKGFEDFRTLRSCEVAGAISYGILALAVLAMDKSFEWICYALPVSQLLRLALVLRGVRRLRRDIGLFAITLNGARSEARFIAGWARIFSVNKVLGALQTQFAPPVIGFMFGPAAVGAVDAITRFPRFAKQVLSLVSSTVMPLAAKLEAGDGREAMTRLGTVGLTIAAVLSFPPMAAAIALSEPTVRLWLGGRLDTVWGWQALMYMIPLTNTLLSFGGSMLLARRHAALAMNRLVALQVVMQIALSFAGAGKLHEWGFVAAQVIAVLTTFALQMALISRELSLPSSLHLRIAALAAICMICGLPAFIWSDRVANPLQLVGVGALVTGTSMLLGSLAVTTRGQRVQIGHAITSRLSRLRSAE